MDVGFSSIRTGKRLRAGGRGTLLTGQADSRLLRTRDGGHHFADITVPAVVWRTWACAAGTPPSVGPCVGVEAGLELSAVKAIIVPEGDSSSGHYDRTSSL